LRTGNAIDPKDRLNITFRLASFPVFLLLFLFITSFDTNDPAYRLVGIWESEEKNLQIEIYQDKEHLAGRMIWFKCVTDSAMHASVDTENPDDRLNGRKLLGLTLVENLSYQGDDVWDEGKIYDPNTGYTFEARIQMKSHNTAVVRGYWKVRWLGRSMVFNRKR
jgi:uncharacterized protein (DUF2147 family)